MSMDTTRNDPRAAQAVDPKSGASDDPRVDPTPDARQSATTAETTAETNNLSPGDGIMEDDLTEEREITPAEREDVAETQKMDP